MISYMIYDIIKKNCDIIYDIYEMIYVYDIIYDIMILLYGHCG